MRRCTHAPAARDPQAPRRRLFAGGSQRACAVFARGTRVGLRLGNLLTNIWSRAVHRVHAASTIFGLAENSLRMGHCIATTCINGFHCEVLSADVIVRDLSLPMRGASGGDAVGVGAATAATCSADNGDADAADGERAGRKMSPKQRKALMKEVPSSVTPSCTTPL